MRTRTLFRRQRIPPRDKLAHRRPKTQQRQHYPIALSAQHPRQNPHLRHDLEQRRHNPRGHNNRIVRDAARRGARVLKLALDERVLERGEVEAGAGAEEVEGVLRAEAEREGRAEAADGVGDGAAGDGACDAAEADAEEGVGVDLASLDRGVEL